MREELHSACWQSRCPHELHRACNWLGRSGLPISLTDSPQTRIPNKVPNIPMRSQVRRELQERLVTGDKSLCCRTTKTTRDALTF